MKKADKMKIEHNELAIKDGELLKIYIEPWESTRAKIIIYNYHLPSHLSADKLHSRISAEYIGISRDIVREYVKKCEACNMAGSFVKKQNLTYIIAHKTHERLFMDLIDLKKYHEINNGYKYILTCIDSFSKFAFCYLIMSKDSEIIAEKLEGLCSIEGRWDKIHTDNGKKFCNKHFKDIIDKFNMIHVKGRPRYLESQGQIERFYGTLKRRLSKCLFGKEKMWISVLRDVLFQHNSSIHKATSKSIFEIFRGIKIRTNSLFHCNKISFYIIKNTEIMSQEYIRIQIYQVNLK
ncbi:Pro-Pol polyprotein [Dictyocoela muelleri]|nr:Pro-Pol polyprotein [Dictyocoela muelleri]